MGWKEYLRQVYVTWRWIWPHSSQLLKSILSQGVKSESNLIQFLLESVGMGQVIYLQYPIKAAVVTIWTLTLATWMLAKSRLKPFWKWYQYHSHHFPACDSGAWAQTRWLGEGQVPGRAWVHKAFPVQAHLGWESLRQSAQRKYLLVISCQQEPSMLEEGITKIGLAPRWALNKQVQIQSKQTDGAE